MAKRMTAARKREIEARIAAISDELCALNAETGMMIDIGGYCADSPTIFIHDVSRNCLFLIDDRSKVDGFFSSKRFIHPSGRDRKEVSP